MTNILVVVIRYFGGTKLGVGGLIQAERVINDFELNVQNRDFKLSCEIFCLIKKDQIASFQEKTKDLYNIAFKIEEQ